MGPVNNVIATGAASAANFQVGANAGDSLAVSFAGTRSTAAGYGSLHSVITAFETATNAGTDIGRRRIESRVANHWQASARVAGPDPVGMFRRSSGYVGRRVSATREVTTSNMSVAAP